MAMCTKSSMQGCMLSVELKWHTHIQSPGGNVKSDARSSDFTSDFKPAPLRFTYKKMIHVTS